MIKKRAPSGRPLGGLLASTILAASLLTGPAHAQSAGLQPILPDLSHVVKDEDWARILGKALFWEQKLGSDGMACASCHFSAGADPRISNQLSPGLLQVTLDGAGNQIGATDGSFGNADGLMPSGQPAGPNYTVRPEDFPFHQLADGADRNSAIITTTNDRMASAGSFDADFKSVGRSDDRCGKARSDVFHVNGRAARAVEPRNTPTTINAVFNFRNFWDGRAKDVFNGKGVFGRSEITNDPTARVIEFDGHDAALAIMEIDHASLASQAVGPPLSNLEMSCDGRMFADVGKKMLGLVKRPLSGQKVAADDSLFGSDGPKGNVINRTGTGLKYTYEQLVKMAFHEKYWKAPGSFTMNPDGTLEQAGGSLFSLFSGLPFVQTALADSPLGEQLFGNGALGRFLSGYRIGHGKKGSYSQMEHNFSLFFGLSVMLYEADLISDQSRFDAATAGGCFITLPPAGGPPRQAVNPSCVANGLLTQKEADGFALFSNFAPPAGACVACHTGPLFSDATRFVGNDPFDVAGQAPLVLQVGANPGAFRDIGFHNIGSRPVNQDLGNGGLDPWGQPLSVARQVKHALQPGGSSPADGYDMDLCDLLGGPPGTVPLCPGGVRPDADDFRLSVDGSMKTPSLRNVALTPPYFHYGGYSTLEQVVEFYARGGSRRDISDGDDSGTGANGDRGAVDANAHPSGGSGTNVFIAPLNLAIDPAGGKDQRYGIEAIAAFMRTMTDTRVQCDAAPFDHPSLVVPNGHKANGQDNVLKIPAVGRNGAAGTAYGCLPNAGDLFAIQTRVSAPN
ncbi:MAG: cytochrome c peroxidase [Alphaproteobacteria bacterium]